MSGVRIGFRSKAVGLKVFHFLEVDAVLLVLCRTAHLSQLWRELSCSTAVSLSWSERKRFFQPIGSPKAISTDGGVQF